MIIPDKEPEKTDFVKWVIDTCTNSIRDRKDLYERRRRYLLFGSASDSESLYNRLESHLDLVSSFLYSPDNANFNIAANRNADDATIRQVRALQDDWNDDFRDHGFAGMFSDALMWSLCYDTMLIKSGWNNTREHGFSVMVPPEHFGVFNEANPDLDSQQAFCHSYYIEYDQAVQRLMRAGKGELIPRMSVSNTPFESPFPDLINRLIITATGGENLSGNIVGSVNPSYQVRATYKAKVNTPLAKFHEVYIWDDANDDWRIFFVVDPDMLVTDSLAVVDALKAAQKFGPKEKCQTEFYNTATNLFLPKDHPFTVVRPHGLYDFFWGRAHIDPLIPLQDWSNERLEQIHDILERQAYPPRVASGFMGMTDDKMEAFGGADTWVYDQLPGAKVEEMKPPMPNDLFADFKEIGGIFLEASGLTDTVAGQGAAGVRSRGHAKELKSSGSGRIKKLAVMLEDPLVRYGELNLKLKMKNDDTPIKPDPDAQEKFEEFVPAQVSEDYTMRIAGHSHSPLFMDDTREMAALLFKAKAIDREMLIRVLNPPGKDDMIHQLRARVKAEAAAARLAPPPKPSKKAAAT